MIENLTHTQFSALLEALPFEITYTDEKDLVQYWYKHEGRIFKRPLKALGKDVRDCHSTKSIHIVDELLADFKAGKKDCLEYNVNVAEKLVNVKYTAVRDNNGKFLGVLETLQDITNIMDVPVKK